MLGWIFGFTPLTDWEGNGITIKFNASLVIAACGLAIVLRVTAPKRTNLLRVFAGLALAIGVFTLFEHVSGIDLGIDTLFFDEPPGAPATAAPGRMGVPASLSAVLLGTALWFISSRKWLSAASMLGLVVILIAWMPISGYLYAAPQLYAFVPFTSIALQTAFFLLFLGIGVIAAVPTHGLGEVFGRPDAGGSVFRFLFLPLVGLSFGLTWLRLFSINSGMLDAASSAAIRAVLELAISVGLLWWVATSISRAGASKLSERRALSELDTHRKVSSAQEAERRRIARDLHDSVGQELTALRLLLHNLPKKHGDEKLSQIQQQAARIDTELSMLVWQLRPKVLDAYGLVAALDNFSRAWGANCGVSVQFYSSLPEKRMDPNLETNLYRIAQEALNNIQKHARAKEVVISLEGLDGQTVLIVQDDGVGFNESDEPIHSTESGGFGMVGMQERASMIGGQLTVETAPGEGTCVTVRVPTL